MFDQRNEARAWPPCQVPRRRSTRQRGAAWYHIGRAKCSRLGVVKGVVRIVSTPNILLRVYRVDKKRDTRHHYYSQHHAPRRGNHIIPKLPSCGEDLEA